MMNGTNRPVDRDEHYTQSGPAAGGRDDNGLEPKLLRIKIYIENATQRVPRARMLYKHWHMVSYASVGSLAIEPNNEKHKVYVYIHV